MTIASAAFLSKCLDEVCDLAPPNAMAFVAGSRCAVMGLHGLADRRIS
jgi:hypothetical protein